ncbi:MAG: TonB-dependent receptor [Chitinophagales bacterium]|nr:TonB-dependent receptor [Chitinophagales bacterium]
MNYSSGSWLTCIFVFFLSPVFAQKPGTIAVMDNDLKEPLAEAVIILQPLNPESGDKQMILFTDQQGELKNVFPEKVAIYIQAAGFNTIQDTVLPGASYTFFLHRLSVNLSEVVVTGQYDINTTDKSIYNIKVIDRSAIESMAAKNLSDVLSNQLNCRLSEDNILGSSVSMNGISGQHVKILIDGVNVIGREGGNIDVSQINMNNVDRIEIVEGPMSVSYGTDAIGGLINIVTRKTSSYPLAADLHLYYETVGTYNGDAAVFWRKRNNAISLSGGRNFFDGFSSTDTSRWMEWKPREQYFTTFNYDYLGKSLKIGFRTDYFQQQIQNKGNPVLTPYQAYAFDDYYFTRRWNNALTAEYRFPNSAKLQFINAYSYYRHIRNIYRTDLVSLEQSLLTAEAIQDTNVFDSWSFRGTYNNSLPLRRSNFQAGYDINLETGKGDKLMSGEQQINDYALFGSVEYRAFNNFFIRPGLRFSYNTRYGAPATPSLNIRYGFLSKYTVRASYAHGFRAPSLKELDLYFVDINHNIIGNSELQAETSDNFGLSFTAVKEEEKWNLKADAALFYNSIHNIITLALVDQAAQLYTYINLDEYKTAGTTISASLNSAHLSLTTGFSLTGLFNVLSDSFAIDKFSLTPELRNNLLLTFPKAGFECAVFFKHTGETPSFNLDAEGKVIQVFTGAYTILDFSATKYALQKRIGFSAGIKNIFNVVNIQSNANAGAVHTSGAETIPYATGRFVFASVRFKFYRE